MTLQRGDERRGFRRPTGPLEPILIKPTAAYHMYVSHVRLSHTKMLAKVSHLPVLSEVNREFYGNIEEFKD